MFSELKLLNLIKIYSQFYSRYWHTTERILPRSYQLFLESWSVSFIYDSVGSYSHIWWRYYEEENNSYISVHYVDVELVHEEYQFLKNIYSEVSINEGILVVKVRIILHDRWEWKIYFSVQSGTVQFWIQKVNWFLRMSLKQTMDHASKYLSFKLNNSTRSRKFK